ncbi:SufD family Fe-S cluster assembly protein [Candidatus Woesebacteria bacterium]|nr:SufD family Fe-S cluster assembly protein [Candidatus Woesebacteria bacterium]
MTKIVKKYSKPGKWEVNVPFEKVEEEISWTGVIDAREAGEYELRVVADHKVAGTKGRITVRAVAGAGAHVKITGMIKIRKEAQETDDYLELRVLTLDKSARAVTEPELEIEANNVKASHGASVGPVDGEQILYLTGRGLSYDEAVDLVIAGWLGN